MNKTIFGLFAVILLFKPLTVQGALVEVDWLTGGDHFLTRDCETNLEWLDLTETAGYSYNQIMGGEGDFITSKGFRYASISEIETLFMHTGLLVNQLEWVEGTEDAQALLNMIGTLYIDQYSLGTSGYSADASPYGTGQTVANLFIYDFNGVLKYAAEANMNNGRSPDEGHYSTGSWLVRDVVVPIPGSLYLLASGLFSFITLFRRKGK